MRTEAGEPRGVERDLDAARPRGRAELLAFLMPGLLHGLGNSLFSIQGHAQLLGIGPGEREKHAILKAAERAQATLEVARQLTGEPGERPETAASGVLLARICEVARVPLRMRGLRLDYEQSARGTPASVDARVLCEVVADVLLAIVDALPAGFDGRVRVDLAAHAADRIEIAFEPAAMPGTLPFPVDREALVARCAARVGAVGASIGAPPSAGGGGAGLRVRLPTLMQD